MRKICLVLVAAILIFGNVLLSSAGPVYVHRSFDWEGDGGVNDSGIVETDESCVACHKDLMQMVVSRELLNVCEDCHLEGGRGPFSRDIMQIRDDIDNITPTIYSHYTGSTKIDVPDQSGIFNGAGISSCFGLNTQTGEGSCHGVTFAFNTSADGYFTFNENYTGKLKDGDPYMWNAPVEKMPDTSDCRFCHLQENLTIRKVWGGAGDIDHEACTDATNEGCWNCHAGGGKPDSFHSVDVFKVKMTDSNDKDKGLGINFGLVSVFAFVVSFVLLMKNVN
ncbi:MAG: hypothetical protein P1P69_05445 [Methanosarcinaceae archaeon]|nr:hypothetical protein [Methanosarcinaceae archaeon]